MTTVAESAGTIKFDTDLTWRAAVQRLSILAQTKLPETLHARMAKATALVLAGGVFVEEDGTAMVRASDGERWYHVNGHCSCPDGPSAPNGFCKHRLARGLYLRASALQHAGFPDTEPGALPPAPPAAPDAPAQSIPPQHVVVIQGKRALHQQHDTKE
jgi:hypothetical protein